MTGQIDNSVFTIHDHIKAALDNRKPIVALESTILSHGMPFPENIETITEVEKIIRDEGAFPASIAVLDGKIHIGLTAHQIERLAKSGEHQKVMKLTRKDIPYALMKNGVGAVTISGAVFCAEQVGITTLVTGGIGGVHRNVSETFDISQDLLELSRSHLTVVSSGVKSILDIGKTVECLETLGVTIIGYNTTQFPAFYCRDSGFLVDFTMNSVDEIAQYCYLKEKTHVPGCVLVVNPVPKDAALDAHEIEEIIQQALEDAQLCGVRGKEVTPYLLSAVASKTSGRSLCANIELIKHNAKIGAQIAKAKLQVN